MSITDEVRDIVREKSAGYGDLSEKYFHFHIEKVSEYAKGLAKRFGADSEIVELASLLHDFTIESHGNDEHHITGSEGAEKILSSFGYPPERIEKVKRCIERHRCKNGFFPDTIEERIIATSDSLAHLDMLLIFPWIGKKDGLGIRETVEWIYEKLKRDLEKKIFFDDVRKEYRERFDSAIRMTEDTLRILG